MIEFLLKMVWITELVCLTDESVGDQLEDGWVVEGPVVKVSIAVSCRFGGQEGLGLSW